MKVEMFSIYINDETNDDARKHIIYMKLGQIYNHSQICD